MIFERLLSSSARSLGERSMDIKPVERHTIPRPVPGQHYMLYAHVPFCERLCPYCSFNRFPYREDRARPYFRSLREEMRMLADLGYDFESLYVGGGTPTILIDELEKTIELARGLFHIGDVSSETNPNHLVPRYLDKLSQMVQRLSVGVQSFDDGLLKQMQRFEKYGSAEQILERIQSVEGIFKTLNIDMIFNFPSQTEDMLLHDVEMLRASRCTQATFYPLMASPAVEKSLKQTLGEVRYDREYRFYRLIDAKMTGPDPVTGKPAFTHSSAWTFSSTAPDMIDEYVVNNEEYPAIGSGGFSYLCGSLYVNTFSLGEYSDAISQGRLSVMGRADFSALDRMRYRFMISLFGMRLDKRAWERDFGRTVQASLPLEYRFMKLAGAFDIDDDEQITLTPKGRYLTVVMMRQFFIMVNSVRDQARAALPVDERELLFGDDGIPCQKA